MIGDRVGHPFIQLARLGERLRGRLIQPKLAALGKERRLPQFTTGVYSPIQNLPSGFKTSRHYLASVPPHTLPAPLRG